MGKTFAAGVLASVLFMPAGQAMAGERLPALLASLQTRTDGNFSPVRVPGAMLAQTCGLCTEHSDCGSGFRCCTGKCSGTQKACYQVTDCANAR